MLHPLRNRDHIPWYGKIFKAPDVNNIISPNGGCIHRCLDCACNSSRDAVLRSFNLHGLHTGGRAVSNHPFLFPNRFSCLATSSSALLRNWGYIQHSSRSCFYCNNDYWWRLKSKEITRKNINTIYPRWTRTLVDTLGVVSAFMNYSREGSCIVTLPVARFETTHINSCMFYLLFSISFWF